MDLQHLKTIFGAPGVSLTVLCANGLKLEECEMSICKRILQFFNTNLPTHGENKASFDEIYHSEKVNQVAA